jgi:hypothetical protein
MDVEKVTSWLQSVTGIGKWPPIDTIVLQSVVAVAE